MYILMKTKFFSILIKDLMLFLEPEILSVLVIWADPHRLSALPLNRAAAAWSADPDTQAALYSLGPADLSVTVFYPKQLTSLGDVAPILTEALHRAWAVG